MGYKEKLAKLPDELARLANVERPALPLLRRMAEVYGVETKFGNFVWSTSVRNRSAALTVVLGSPEVASKSLNERQQAIKMNLSQTLAQILRYIKMVPFVSVERRIGDNLEFTPHCRLFVSTQRKDCIRIAHMWSQTVFDPNGGPGPNLALVFLPEWQEKDRQVLVFPEQGLGLVLGTDYHGEAKKGFLRLAMWEAKKKGMLGLHAGSKILKARTQDGKIRRLGMMLFGLSATGKTTHSCHHHGLNAEGEGVEIIQDDVVFWKEDASALGTERGFFLKTDNINPETQPLLFRAATQRDAVFENVMVDFEGNVNFQDEVLSQNGRGVVQRRDLGEFKSESINLPPLSELDGLILAFITRRNTILPIASKLTPEQAAAAFMLGESIETAAGDPRRVGESVRVVGTNPFIIGDPAFEGNWLYEQLKRHEEKIECYLLNTGGVGEIMERDEKGERIIKQEVLRVEIPEMAAIIRAIARDTIEWQEEPYFGTPVPKAVPDVDMKKFDFANFYSPGEIEALVSQLKKERREYLAQFADLNPAITKAF